MAQGSRRLPQRPVRSARRIPPRPRTVVREPQRPTIAPANLTTEEREKLEQEQRPDACAICRQTKLGHDIAELTCSHSFHIHCREECSKHRRGKAPKCPMCDRHSLNSWKQVFWDPSKGEAGEHTSTKPTPTLCIPVPVAQEEMKSNSPPRQPTGMLNGARNGHSAVSTDATEDSLSDGPQGAFAVNLSGPASERRAPASSNGYEAVPEETEDPFSSGMDLRGAAPQAPALQRQEVAPRRRNLFIRLGSALGRGILGIGRAAHSLTGMRNRIRGYQQLDETAQS